MTAPRTRIAEYYRTQIRDGALRPGDRLPSVREVSEQHGIATATVRAAMGWLRNEGYIVTTQRGSFVADQLTNATAPADRLTRLRRTGSILGTGETKRVTSAALVVPPLYVAELFDQDPAEQIVRREYVLGSGTQRLALVVDWYPAAFAEAVPELLDTAPGAPDDLLVRVERATGRTAVYGRDSMHGRSADQREASALGVATGSPILAGANEWSDDGGVIVYAEWCLPERLTIGYEYRS